MLHKYAQQTVLSLLEKEFVYETFRSARDERGRPIADMDAMTEASGSTVNRLEAKLVDLTKIGKLRGNSRNLKVQELILLDEDGA